MSPWEEYVRVMLELDHNEPIPTDLRDLMEDVDRMVGLAGGSLRSRQEIAGIIAMWKLTINR